MGFFHVPQAGIVVNNCGSGISKVIKNLALDEAKV
jgi:hypothetical protein